MVPCSMPDRHACGCPSDRRRHVMFAYHRSVVRNRYDPFIKCRDCVLTLHRLPLQSQGDRLHCAPDGSGATRRFVLGHEVPALPYLLHRYQLAIYLI